INELMASNSNSIRDPQGEYDDWIEIHNIGPYPIDMGNMYLTDDLTVPTKWRMPGGRPAATTIPAGGYLLVWADEDVADSGLHAGFKLAADGEEIGMFDSDGTTHIDSVVFPEQTSGISYGRDPNAANSWRFLAVPTPGAKNDAAYMGEVKAPEFSHERGFYNAPFLLTLATETKDAIIYYTTDGAAPYEFAGRSHTGTAYSSPILISKSTCVRAKAIKPGWKPSAITTRTFLLNADDAVKSLPVISLVGDSRRTFYEPDGVMAIVGGHYGTDGTWTADSPKNYNNPMQRGMAYERPVSFEWIRPQDDSGFQVDCGIRVHGSNYMRPRYQRSAGYWTGSAKFSFRLYFRNDYGPSWLDYPLFPFEVERFKSIALRGGHNDRVNPFVKDELLRRLHKDMGNVASGGTMANLFINGEYKGYFNPCEHVKDAFCQQWYHSDRDWDVMTMNGIRDGDAVAWNDMINYARSHNLYDEAYYLEMAGRLDIPAFADYLILQLWCGNWDWPQNNWAAAKERSDEGRWRFFIWDAEGGMYSDRLNTVYFDRLNTQTNAIAYLYQSLKVSRTFRQVFCDRIHRHFYNDGALTEANIRKRFLELRDQMRGVIPNMDMYVLSTWVPNRLDIFLDACTREGVFTVAGPTFNINGVPQHGGHISTGDTLTISDHGRLHAIHYTMDSSDPQSSNLQPVSPTGTVLVAENAAKGVLVPNREAGDTWKDGAGFIGRDWLYSVGPPGGVGYKRGWGYEGLISLDVETVMYGRNTTCYIRIPFTFAGPGDFKSLILNIRYDDGFIAYLNGTEIARRNFDGTPAWNSSAAAARPDSEAVHLESIDVSAFLGTLQQGDNLLAIHGLNFSATDAGFLISAELVADTDDSKGDLPPPVTQYVNPIALTVSARVKARTLRLNTWSALSEAVFAVGPVAENLRITEIMYHPQAPADAHDPNEEFIELMNVGAETINLNLLRFTEGVDFTFPSLDLAPAQRTVVVEDRSAFESRYGRRANIAGQYSGRLNNAGERIRLEDAVGRTILDFSYKDDWRPMTDGEGFSLAVIDPTNPDLSSWDQKDAWRASARAGGSPGQDDSGILPNPGDIVINEVLAHSHADGADWIELYNTTGT
ncbi:MAG TPA: lamin tail domain-containing protein, partial [Sedimentisphaerales bacterium]|nr:lamin tail domain-containing protein [Sedimentisphaerales bacterium]